MKVFIGGSRKLSRINKQVKDRIDNLINLNFSILLGDANGVDKSVQSYLFSKKYNNIYVFCVNGTCRNNVGGWQVKIVTHISAKKDYKYYSSKDIEMAKEADFGFMIWDGESKGTLNNIINLLKQYKKVLVYYSPKKVFYEIKSFYDLNAIIPKYHNLSSVTVQNLFS